MSRKTQVVLYALFTLGALAFSALVTFPWDAVGRRLEYEAVRALPGASIVIGEVGPALPMGIALGDITLQLPPVTAGKPGAKVEVEKIRVKPALLALLTGKLGATFNVRAFDGDLSGQVKKLKTGQALELTAVAKALQLDDGGVLRDLIGYDIKGGLSGEIELALDEKGVISDGVVDIVIENGLFAGGRINGFTVPALDLGSPELKVTFEKGNGVIEKLALKSADVDASVESGTLVMKQALGMTLIKGDARIKPSDAWLEKAKLKAVIGLVPASVRKPDGTFELALNGPLKKPATLPKMGF